MPLSIDLAMLTVRRPGGEDYIHRTLESLFTVSRGRSLLLHLFVGSADTAHVERYRADPRIAMHPMTEEEWSRMDSRGLAGSARIDYRLVVNYHRALGLAPSAPACSLLVLEDDLVFDPCFWPRLEQAAAECAGHGPRFVTTLYSTHAVKRDGAQAVVPYPDPHGFYGTQCVLYAPEVRSEVAAHFHEAGVVRNEEAVDRMLRTYTERRGVTLWQTHRSLVQHIGRQNTGLHTHWHTSPTFGLPWDDPAPPGTLGNPADGPSSPGPGRPTELGEGSLPPIDGWFDFEDIYREAVSEAGDGARLVEVGAFLGKSASFLAGEVRRSGKRVHVEVVDRWTVDPLDPTFAWALKRYGPSTYEAFLANMTARGHLGMIHPVRLDSLAAAGRHPDASLDFVFIDADHSYEAVRADIRAWLPKVRPGGVLAGHDYDNGTNRAVVLAVDSMLPMGQVQKRHRSWVFRNTLPECGRFTVHLAGTGRKAAGTGAEPGAPAAPETLPGGLPGAGFPGAGLPGAHLLFIPYVNRPDLLHAAVASVRGHWANVVVIDQSDAGLGDPWGGQVAIYRWTAPRSFTRAQNLMQRIAALAGVDWFGFMHSDAECQGDAFGLLLAEARRLDAAGAPWGVIFTAYDALCLFKASAALATGAWDESFNWYVSDLDYYNRLKWAGFTQHQAPAARVLHHTSQTLRALDPREKARVDHDHQWARAHYIHKWGGWHGQETHRVPYGGRH